MENKRIAAKAGLFVFIGLALMGLGLIEFSKGASFFRGVYELRLHAANVGGLKPRASVRLAGVEVGNVSGVQLAPDGRSVTIILKIYDRYKNKIYSDAQFAIQQSGFLGDEYVAIIPTANQGGVLTNGASVKCEPPFNMQEAARSAVGFIQRIDTIAKKLDASVTEMQQVVLNAHTMTNFTVTVDNMREFSAQALDSVAQINGLIVTNGTQVNLALSNVLFFSSQLTLLASSARGVLVTNGVEITAATKNIESSTEILKELMTNLQAGKGLAGAVLRDQELSANVQAAANNLAVASSNLNRLGLWGFLWHKEPVQKPPPRPRKP